MTVRWPRVLTPTQLTCILKSQKSPLTALKIFKEAKEKYPNYHHNGVVYATMVSILGSSSKITEMKEVIDLMKVDSCECKDSVFATAIRTYDRVGLLYESVALFKSIPSFNCVEKTQSFNTLLEILLQRCELEAACHLFLENYSGWEVKSRVCSLNLLMVALCQKNRSDLALQIFQEMDFQGCYPDRESYRILMKGLCENGKLNEATHLLYSMFWRISQKGSGDDVATYRILLNALCDNGQVEEAVEILEKILRKGLKAPKWCRRRLDLAHCYNGEDVEAAKRLVNEALVRRGIPSSASYTSVAVDLYHEGKADQADKVLYEALDRGFRPSLSTWEAKMVALCKDNRISEAVSVIEVEMVEANLVPSVKLYNILLKGLCDVGKLVTAVGYLKKMAKQVGCVANRDTYVILVRGLCQDGQFIEASKVLEEMHVRSHWPPVDVYNKVINGLCPLGRQYEAAVWLEEMISQDKQPELFVWTSLVDSVCCNVAGVNSCLELLKKLSS